MRALQQTWFRELWSFRGSFYSGTPVAAFLAVSGWSFVMLLRRDEGGISQLQSVWGCAVAPWLPILCSLLTMRLFAVERSSGMIELLMASPVRERDLVLGKFLSSLTLVALALFCSMIFPVFILPRISEPLRECIQPVAFMATFGILLLQSCAWCAAGTMISVLYSNQAAAAVTSLILCSGMPIVVYFGILVWIPSVRTEMAWMPLLVHVVDFSTGLFSSGVFVFYSVLSVFFLFACSKALALLRLR
ncbi:MAG: ABC transporter permease subunit [Kiritimatiellae bacterium]|jgi:ABC-2 type transport system permease protein|nr:ABC transporter permease subunit [Kiritimatiellia bacterium]